MMIMINTYISVIIPVYQSVNTIEKCIDSVLSQTYPYLQIILVDDGSTDGSGAICDRYAEKYSNIEVIHISNSGPVVARKEGLLLAKGQYVGFVDSDDYIEDTMYEKLHKVISDDDSDFVHSWYWSIREDEKVCEVNAYNELFDINDRRKRELAFKQLFFGSKKNITPSIWSKLYKKQFLLDNYSFIPENVNYGEDLLLLFACIAKSKKISIVDFRDYNYVIQEKSLSHLKKEEMFFKEIYVLQLLRTLNIKMNYPVKEYVLYEWVRERIMCLLMATVNGIERIQSLQYYITGIEKYRGKKVIIYGAGAVGHDYLRQMELSGLDAPVAICDANVSHLLWGKVKVIRPTEIPKYDYDVVIVSVLDEDCAKEICRDLISLGVDEKSIVWEKPHR